MIDDDKKEFKLLLDAMCEATQSPKFTIEQYREYWDKLNQLPLENIALSIDLWIETQGTLPTADDLLPKHEVTIKPRVVTPLTIENNKAHIAEVKQEMESKPKQRDFKKWARDIVDNPKGKSERQLRVAREALK